MLLFPIVAVASDHADLGFKQAVVDYLKTKGCQVKDLGPSIDLKESVDYPDYAEKLAHAVTSKEVSGAIAICGTGIGMSIATNKFSGIRSACPWDHFTAEMTRRHNNINILCLGARSLPRKLAFELIDIWLETPFDGDRHKKRLDKIAAFDRKSL
jgi:ribose 5-phosphate isomerase B